MRDVRFIGDELVVWFENGDTARVSGASVIPAGAKGVGWDKLTSDPYEIRIPTVTDAIVVPWSTIRLLTDPAYAAFVEEQAAAYARRMGTRIRALRDARGLRRESLAQRAGISTDDLSRIERGEMEISLATLGVLLDAMGCTYEDLAPRRRSTAPSARTSAPR
jgi:DNA-binding Xre family transcriptional regulator